LLSPFFVFAQNDTPADSVKPAITTVIDNPDVDLTPDEDVPDASLAESDIADSCHLLFTGKLLILLY
jgi:hypothetical protein